MIVKSIEKRENNTATFQVEINREEFEAAINRAYLKNKQNIMVPGFRKGKAPRMVIEGMFGSDVFYEDAIDDLSPMAFKFGVDKEALETVGRPTLTDMNISEEIEVTLTFETALYPAVTLGQYKGLEAPKPAVKVEESDVDAELESLRKRNSRLQTVDRTAAEGDTAMIDFEGFINGEAFEGGKGENYNLVLGSGQFIPGFEEQVIGMSAGEEKDINVTFPEDYHEEFAGKNAVFRVKLNEVKETILPELDDEFAKDVSEFDTLEEYRNSVRERLLKSREDDATREFKDALIDKAAKNMTVIIPDAMVEEQVDMIINDYAQNLAMQGYSLEQYLSMMGMDVASFRGSIRPTALRQIEVELLLNKVAEEEMIECTDEEIEAEIARLAELYQLEAEEVKKAISVETLARDLRMRKAANVIYDTGIPTEPVEEEKVKEEGGEEAKTERKPRARKSTKAKAEEKKEEEATEKAE
ncbi:MAG: trigger factor [Oscillospiraceae bacterium]|jgi:trigger factor